MSYTRFAVYYLPPEGDLATFGAAWLGWDVVSGRPASQFDVPQLNSMTATLRKYGFHATLKPPFRLKNTHSAAALDKAVKRMAANCQPALCEGLQLSRLGSFLALTPRGDASEIGRVAAHCVVDLDPFRAVSSEAELAHRRRAGLSLRQNALLDRWGYPYVMEEFSFHLTLTSRLSRNDRKDWQDTLDARLPEMPASFVLDEIALVGEQPDGCFKLIRRYALNG